MLIDFRGFENNPEVAFDFFGLCIRAMKTNKRVFFSCPYIENLLNTWYIGIGNEHRDAIKTHTGFITTLFSILKADLTQISHIDNLTQIQELAKIVEAFPDVHPNEIAVWKFLLEQGQVIIDKELEVVLNAPSRDLVDFFVDVLVAFSFNMPSQCKDTWFQ